MIATFEQWQSQMSPGIFQEAAWTGEQGPKGASALRLDGLNKLYSAHCTGSFYYNSGKLERLNAFNLQLRNELGECIRAASVV